MSKDDNTAVNDEAVQQDAAATDSAPEENNSLEVVEDGPELDPNDFPDEAETDGQEETEADADEPQADETDAEAEEEPQEESPTDDAKDKWESLNGKSHERFQQMNKEAKEWRERYEQLTSQQSQVALENQLLNQINPDTGEEFTPQEAERAARQHANQQTQQRLAQEQQALQIQQNQRAMGEEVLRALKEFPDLDPAQAEQALRQIVQVDQNGNPVGASLSPYQQLKLVAQAAKANDPSIQANAQKATEKMLSQVDAPSSQPAPKSSSNDKDLNAEEYAKKHNLNVVW